MKTPKNILENACKIALAQAFDMLDQCDINKHLEVTQSTQDKFGHYQFNSAMRLAKTLGLPPRKIAEKVIEHLNAPDIIEKLEVAGPGFINITLTPSFIKKNLQSIAKDEKLGIENPKQKKRVIVEFSSPNIAKELHVGHLRSTIIGDSIARLFEFLGHDVLRLNHLGDWGTQFGMLIAYLKEEAPKVLTGEEDTDLSHLVTWYKESKQKFDNDSEFRKKAQNEVPLLQGGDKKSLEAWQMLCNISQKAYKEIYDLLDVKITDRGESFYNPVLKDVVQTMTESGIVAISEGAKCIFIEGFQNREGSPLPLIIQKSDGGYNYATTDLAALKHRIEFEKADRIIYVTDAGQTTHFQMFFKAAEKAGFWDPKKVEVNHVTFGLVLGPDGKKFKTRSGKTEKLIDLLNTAIQRAYQIVDARSFELSDEEKHTLAKRLGIGAVKYADLSCHRTGDYTFSYDRMLRFEGNTCAYLMYSYVRIQGLQRKTGANLNEIIKSADIQLKHPSELDLGLHLLRFGEALEMYAEDLLPNRLTDYLYILAEKFNAFFRDCRVEGSDKEKSRLLLSAIVARTMKLGLFLLGVKTVDRM